MDYSFAIDNQAIDILIAGEEYQVFINALPTFTIYTKFDDEFGVTWLSNNSEDLELIAHIGQLIENADDIPG